MNKKNLTIGILVLVLLISLYFTFQTKQSIKIQNKISDTSITDRIQPSEELKNAFEKSRNTPPMASIAELSCFPTSRFDCGGDSCTASAPATYYFVDYGTESGTYFRCNAKGCDSYPVEVNTSGEFTQFTPSQGQAMMFKVATGDALGNKGKFIDIATLGTGAIVSSGQCEFRK